MLQSRFGQEMHPGRTFPLFPTDSCSAVPARFAPVYLILFRPCADLYFQRDGRIPAKTMSILNSRPPPTVLAAASLWLFQVDAKLAWLAGLVSQSLEQSPPAFGAIVASPSQWLMDLVPEPGSQLQ